MDYVLLECGNGCIISEEKVSSLQLILIIGLGSNCLLCQAPGNKIPLHNSLDPRGGFRRDDDDRGEEMIQTCFKEQGCIEYDLFLGQKDSALEQLLENFDNYGGMR